MSFVDLISTYREDDSDTFSVDSLEVNTDKDTKDFLKPPFDKYQIRGTECTDKWVCTQLNTVEEHCHTSKISNRNAIGPVTIKEDKDTLVKRSESNSVKGNAYTSKSVSTKSYSVQERRNTSRKPVRKIVEGFSFKDDEDTLVKRYGRYPFNGQAFTTCNTSTIPETQIIEAFSRNETDESGMTSPVKWPVDDRERLEECGCIQASTVRLQQSCHTSRKPVRKTVDAFSIKDDNRLVKCYERYPVKDQACTSDLLTTHSNNAEETCHSGTILETQKIEAGSVNETEENGMTSPVKFPIDGRERLKELRCTQSSTERTEQSCYPNNIPARKEAVEAFCIKETVDSEIQTVDKFSVSTCTLDWVFAQSKTVQETEPEGNLEETFSTKKTQDNPTKSSKKYPVTVLECTSEWVCTLSTIGQDLKERRHMEETSNKTQLPNKRDEKIKKQLEVPFYNRKVALSEVRKIQKLNRPDRATKKKSTHVLAGDEYERTSRLHAQSKGVVERWRHNVKPIYEHSTLVQLAMGKDKSHSSAMTTISDAVSKMKIEESNQRPRRASRSVCGVRRFASPAVHQNTQAQKPPALLFGYIRTKTSSYLEQYRMEKYGPIYVKRKPPSDGTECSVFEGSTVESLSSELKDKPANFSSPESSGDELSFYRKIISGELNPSKADYEEGRAYQHRLSDEYDNLRSVSQVDVNANRESCPRRRSNYVPYSLEDYRTMLQPTRLGRLGPDLEANKEKFERLRKQREYGDMASLKNIRKMQFQKMKTQLQLQTEAEASTQPYTNRFSEDEYGNSFPSTFRQHEPRSHVTSATANRLSTSSPETQSNRKTTTTRRTKTKKTMTKGKRKEQETFTSNKSLIKTLQERHKRELEITEKLRQESLM